MRATTEQVKQILQEARTRRKHLDWEMQGYTEGPIPEDLLDALANTEETIMLCKARLEQDGVV